MQSNIPIIFSHLATVPQTDFSLHSSISAIKNIKFHQISSSNKKQGSSKFEGYFQACSAKAARPT